MVGRYPVKNLRTPRRAPEWDLCATDQRAGLLPRAVRGIADDHYGETFVLRQPRDKTELTAVMHATFSKSACACSASRPITLGARVYLDYLGSDEFRRYTATLMTHLDARRP